MEVKLYPVDPTDDTLQDDLTYKHDRMVFSTRLHGGFAKCRFRLKADLPEAWEWITKRLFFRLKITDVLKTLWEGRLEDITLTSAGVEVTAYGYWASMTDVPYTTAYNANADVVIKAVLTAVCPQIDSDQTNIDATGGPAIDSGAADGYLDITAQEIVRKLLKFSDDTNNAKWYFAIWEDRIPYMSARSVSTVNWNARLQDFAEFKLGYRGGDLWNSAYAVYEVGGAVARTADANDTDSQTKYGLTRKYAISNLGGVAAGAAQSARDGWLANHKDAWPRLTNMVLGQYIADTNGRIHPSSWVRAGEVLRVMDLVPASIDAGTVSRDALRTYYIVETEYDVERGRLKIVPDTRNKRLSTQLAIAK